MHRHLFFLLGILLGYAAFSQGGSIVVKVTDSRHVPLPDATVVLLKPDSSSLVKALLADSAGKVSFDNLALPRYLLHVSFSNYTERFVAVRPGKSLITIELQDTVLDGVTIRARKPFIEIQKDRTVVNVDAAATNAGTSVLEALEKLPNVSIDRDGNISLKGRAGVTVYIDGKPTYLTGENLAALLSGIGTSQVAQIELIDKPSAAFDAGGGAGVINLKLKKTTLQGFNGTVTAGYSQGYYPKSSGDGILLNYRSGRTNLFLNYGFTSAKNFNRASTLRTYFKNDGTVDGYFDQPSFLMNDVLMHNLRTGLDYSLSRNTSLSGVLSGFFSRAQAEGSNNSYRLSALSRVDSIINTTNDVDRKRLDMGGLLSFRHSMQAAGEISADVELRHVRTRRFDTTYIKALAPATYSQNLHAQIPTDINILSARADYSGKSANLTWTGGFKFSKIKTDNLSAYQYYANGAWLPDTSKSNQFVYDENIYAAYVNSDARWKKWQLSVGLRYEFTHYDARQVSKDVTFSRNYANLFPNLSVSYEADSANSFAFTAGRRIDRPFYADLNPFVFIINRYTYLTGNPHLTPQYQWNFAVSHSYKNMLTSELNYSIGTDYLSPVFLLDGGGIVTYTKGNLSRLQNIGATVAWQSSPQSWWTFTLQPGVNWKKFEGFIGYDMEKTVTQYSINLNNQLRFGKGWSGELSGFYSSASRDNIQETLDPYGQLSFGLAKSVLRNNGTIKLALRDALYTNWTKGFASLSNTTEAFKLTRDTRVATLSFTWRFGQPYKKPKTADRSNSDEIQRAGSND